MKHSLRSATLGLFSLASVSLVATFPQKVAAANPPGVSFVGGSYVTTITDSQGAFASRGVFTFNRDFTMSAIDSGQGGPAFFFSSQLGAWKVAGPGEIAARTIDFDYPPNADIARLDYTVQLSADGTQITGTIKLTIFPLTSNPLDGGGTVGGTFSFTGSLITP
ncbi:MAG: hypothetical protein JO232_18800 [Verrucomicrobia bacterium]|nr:hypothetical protein [Verrucomicrobiota bacterium]